MLKSHVFSFFFFLNLFIYFWLRWVFVSARGLSLVAASGGHSSSRCAGLSPSRPLLLRSTGSRRAGSAVVAHGPSRSAACGILPDQGSNPCPLHWQADSQPLRHQGSPSFFFKFFYTAGSYQLSILYILVYICQSRRPRLFIVSPQGAGAGLQQGEELPSCFCSHRGTKSPQIKADHCKARTNHSSSCYSISCKLGFLSLRQNKDFNSSLMTGVGIQMKTRITNTFPENLHFLDKG